MKLKQDKLTQELNKLLPTGKGWLLTRGYISTNTEFGETEYSWTEGGREWINGLRSSSTQQGE